MRNLVNGGPSRPDFVRDYIARPPLVRESSARTTLHSAAIPVSFRFQRAVRAASNASVTIAMVVALSACADKTPPLENSFCVVYQRLPDPADAIHMKKRENKIAVLTNEQSADRECRSGDRGPR